MPSKSTTTSIHHTRTKNLKIENERREKRNVQMTVVTDINRFASSLLLLHIFKMYGKFYPDTTKECAQYSVTYMASLTRCQFLL